MRLLLRWLTNLKAKEAQEKSDAIQAEQDRVRLRQEAEETCRRIEELAVISEIAQAHADAALATAAPQPEAVPDVAQPGAVPAQDDAEPGAVLAQDDAEQDDGSSSSGSESSSFSIAQAVGIAERSDSDCELLYWRTCKRPRR